MRLISANSPASAVSRVNPPMENVEPLRLNENVEITRLVLR